jgi:uncharacterized membrane protein (DUF4010 family)
VTDFIESRMLQIAVAVALGLLVGLQREWTTDKPIGLRSFALISTIGALVGLLSERYGAWVLGAGLIAVTFAIFSHTFFLSRRLDVAGMTTELAAIAVFLAGVLATSGYVAEAVVIAGVVTLLLHWKAQMQEWVKRIGKEEFQAVARFVLITLVVLPVLPNRAYGPYAVLNPWQIWLMVVLIVGLNLAGYVSLRISSGKGSALLNGVLGGMISSTAATVSFAKRSQSDRLVIPIASTVILIASALVYVRILIETAAVARGLLPHLFFPVAAFSILFLIVIGVLLVRRPAGSEEEVTPGNPAELKTALGFGLLYSAVLFISAAVGEQFGDTMLYPVAIVSGLTDVDAITLSIGRLFVESRIEADAAWRVIFVASLSNLAFKAGIVAVIGGGSLRRQVLPALVGLTVLGFVGVLVWP